MFQGQYNFLYMTDKLEYNKIRDCVVWWKEHAMVNNKKKTVEELAKEMWIFSCGNTANPAGREPPVRACGNRLCEFTRVMFCLIHRPHALRCHARHLCLWYWCDNYHGQCDQWLHLPKDWHLHRVAHTIPRIRTESRKLLKISCVSDGAARRYPFVLNLLVSIEAIHPESGHHYGFF